MSFEKTSLINIEKKFNEFGASKPTIWWEHGVLWADYPNKDEVNLIKEGLEDSLAPGFKVGVSCLKATKTEPWDQYAFDIMEDK